MKTISILGSTGSIGTQTLDVVRHQNDVKVAALAAGRNIRKLEEQIREFHPRIAAVWDEADARELRQKVADISVRVVSGMEGLIEVATVQEADLVFGAIVGMIGIVPTIAAIREGKDIALANKETLVCAGHLIMPLIRQYHVHLYPVDSEHSAIFQCLNGENPGRIEKILLTCSGGPFYGYGPEKLETVTVSDALKNPNWNMGRKITIDSATLVNKGLEVMEAGWLFSVTADQVEVVIQRQSIVHSAVQFVDGAVIAQMGMPDMRGSVSFARPDMETFRGLPLAYDAMKKGGSMPTVFNAANEAAVARFLDRRISFLQIYEMIEECCSMHKVIPNPTVQEILDVQKSVMEHIRTVWDKD